VSVSTLQELHKFTGHKCEHQTKLPSIIAYVGRLTYNKLGILNGSTSYINAWTERTEAVNIRRTHLNQRNI